MNPASYIPTSASDFIGQSAKLAQLLERKAASLKLEMQPVKMLFLGNPGLGKTALANMFARRLAGHEIQIESVNGQNVTAALIRSWQDSAPYYPMHGGYSVKVVNELDTASTAAQNLLLSYLDEMPRHLAVIGTSNLNLSEMSVRFQTRLQQFQLQAPSAQQISELLATFGLSQGECRMIADKCKGNVRAAMLDAQSLLDMAAIAA